MTRDHDQELRDSTRYRKAKYQRQIKMWDRALAIIFIIVVSLIFVALW